MLFIRRRDMHWMCQTWQSNVARLRCQRHRRQLMIRRGTSCRSRQRLVDRQSGLVVNERRSLDSRHHGREQSGWRSSWEETKASTSGCSTAVHCLATQHPQHDITAHIFSHQITAIEHRPAGMVTIRSQLSLICYWEATFDCCMSMW